ncbi:MAG: dephospho-CoA kinase [Gallionella sp.]
MTLCVGLTGGIGCGKSTIAELFAQHGAGIIDTDQISHRLTQIGGAAIPAISKAFGKDFITADGALDRDRMRGLIFSDMSAKQCLENILHPLILEHAKAQLQQMQDAPYIIIVVPLLPESASFRQLVQRVLVVDCDEDTRIARVVRRSGMTVPEVHAIIAQQTPPTERLQMADDVIHNDADLPRLAEQVAMLHGQYLAMQNNN